MITEYAQIAPVKYTGQIDPLAPPFRDPFRHPVQHGPHFQQKFDYETVLFDIFDDGEGGLIAISPQMGREVKRHGLCFLDAQGRALPFRHLRRWNLDMFRIETPDVTAPVTVRTDLFEQTVTPSASRLELFEGRRVLLFVNKNNHLQWIRDFVTFYVTVHGADAVCLYDNGSTEYTLDELHRALGDIAGLELLTITHWPFKWGVTDGNSDSSFCQRAFLEHARWRCLNRARSVLQCDVDELIFSDGSGGIFEKVEASTTGYVSVRGRWMAHTRAEHFEVLGPPRHHHFTRTDISGTGWCGKKWACVPGKVAERYQWMVHDVFGGMKPDPDTSGLVLRHYMGLNTGWKQANRATAAIDEQDYGEEERVVTTMRRLFDRSEPVCVEENLVEAAHLTFAAGRIRESLRAELLAELETRALTHPWLAMLTARHFEKKKEDDKAEPIYRRVLEQDPTVHEAAYFLSYIRERAGDRAEAETFIAQAVEAEPTNLRYLQRYITFLRGDKRFAEIVAAVDRALDWFPDDPAFLIEKARGMSRLNLAAEALEMLEAAGLPDAGVLNVHDRLFVAELCIQCGRWQEALENVQAVLVQTPERPWAHHVLSLALEGLGQAEAAKTAAAHAFELNPGSKVFRARLGKFGLPVPAEGT
ncbi:MAG: hypothetical protein GYB51_20360 [Rhodobacteraceae bacterium]|nr:hypothetical protein [Paracoccaceae bacterium]